MNQVNPVDEKRVFNAATLVKVALDGSNLNEHERILLLKDLLAHEENVLERKNHAYVMLNALNRINK